MSTDLSLSSLAQVINLINFDNGTTLDTENIELLEPVPLLDSPSERNTRLTITATPNGGFSGSVSIDYNRLNLNGFTAYGSPSIIVEEGQGLEDIISSFNLLYDANISVEDDIASSVEVPEFDYVGKIITLKAKTTSLAFIGQIDLEVKLESTSLDSVLVKTILNGLQYRGAPGAPMNVIAEYGDEEATIYFTAPMDDGGDPITGYEVTSSPGDFIFYGVESPIVATGLTNGTAYTFTVKARNSFGLGSVSLPSNEVTPTSFDLAPNNWTPLARYLGTGVTDTVAALATDRGGTWVGVTTGNRCFRSTDNGVIWSEVGISSVHGGYPVTYAAIDTDGEGTWIAVGWSGYGSVSTDNGVTWSALPSSAINTTESFMAICTDRKGNWVVGTGNDKLFTSNDNGVTWVESLSPSGFAYSANDIATDGEGNWVVGFTSGKAVISNDNGLNWVQLPVVLGLPIGTTTSIKAVNYSGGVWLAGVGLDVAKSTDGGETWTIVNPRGLNSDSTTRTCDKLVCDDKGNWLVIFDAAYASISSDNGETWSGLPRGLNSGGTAGIDILAAATDCAGKWIICRNNGYASVGTP